MNFAKLIKEYYLSIALILFFGILVLFVPFFYYYPVSFDFKGLSLRCFLLDLGASLVFYLLDSGKYKSLLLFSLSGLFLSLAYLKDNYFYFVPPCLSFTITAVIMVSFLAYLKLTSD